MTCANEFTVTLPPLPDTHFYAHIPLPIEVKHLHTQSCTILPNLRHLTPEEGWAGMYISRKLNAARLEDARRSFFHTQ